MNSRVFALGLTVVLILSSVFIASHAAGPTGIENIALSSHSVNLTAGSNAIVYYNLSLISGYYEYGTELYIVGYKQLGAANVTVLITNKSGNPPIRGTMYIFLSHVLEPGTYNITLAGNSSGTRVDSDTIILNVLSSQSTTTTTLTSTTTTSTTTTSTTTTSTITTTSAIYSGGTAKQNNNSTYYVVAVIIAIVIVVVIISSLKGSSKGSGKQSQQPAQKSNTA